MSYPVNSEEVSIRATARNADPVRVAYSCRGNAICPCTDCKFDRMFIAMLFDDVILNERLPFVGSGPR